MTFLSWYRQSLGSKPVIISTWMKYSKEVFIHTAYKERFQVESGESINHLKISRLRLSDTAVYYCGILEFNMITFAQGVLLHVKPSLANTRAIVHQAALELLRAGDSVNLTCAVYSEKCAGPQSYFWFRHGAGQPVIMSQNLGDCANNDSHTNCTLNYPIQSVSSSDAGMYHCGLASCGNIVFGNGTRVVITSG